jgi:DNA-binding HxlR family transcriptional regulator
LVRRNRRFDDHQFKRKNIMPHLVKVNDQRTGRSTHTDELGIRRRNGFGGTGAGVAGTGKLGVGRVVLQVFRLAARDGAFEGCQPEKARFHCLERRKTVPEFDSDDDRSYYLVRLPAHPRAKTAGQEAGEATSTGQVTGQVIGHADSWILDVLRACRFLPLKSSEIQALTGIKHRETFQRNYLDRLIKEDWIERTIPDKPTSRLQKYRLTEKGRRLLENR